MVVLSNPLERLQDPVGIYQIPFTVLAWSMSAKHHDAIIPVGLTRAGYVMLLSHGKDTILMKWNAGADKWYWELRENLVSMR